MSGSLTEVTSLQRSISPYQSIGLIITHWRDGTNSLGTCTLVGMNDILTAGHMTYSPSNGGWASSYDFYFGADYNRVTGQFEDYGYHVTYSRWQVLNWIDGLYQDTNYDTNTYAETQYDVALIGIDTAVGSHINWLNLSQGYNTSNLQTMGVGYPSGTTGMTSQVITVDSLNPSYGIYRTTDSNLGPGSSGGPLLLTQSDGSTSSTVIGVKSTTSGWADLDLLWDDLTAYISSDDVLMPDLTPPTVSSLIPNDQAINVDLSSNIAITFSESVHLGAGLILLEKIDGQLVESFDPQHSNRIQVSNQTLTINPTSDLSYNTQYRITLNHASVLDDANNPIQVFSSSGFRTISPNLGNRTGSSGNDLINNLDGFETINGSAGIDTISYNSRSSNHSIEKNTQGFIITDLTTGAIDTLINVERLQFLDKNLAIDLDDPNSAGGIYRLYQASFDRSPDLSGLGYWINQSDNGKSAVEIAEDFTWSTEFLSLFGIQHADHYLVGSNITNVVTGLYQHVLHRAPDAGGLSYYTNVIADHQKTIGRVLAEISDSPENHVQVVGQIEHGIEYTPWIT